jgi:hypothetical protein
MKSIASLLFFSFMALLGFPQEQKPAPQFSADVRVWNKRDSVAHMKIFVGSKKARLNRQHDLSGYHSVQSLIIDSEARSVFLLVPEKKSYVESTELAADLSHGASIFRPSDPSNPCAEWIELVRKHFQVELRCRKIRDEILNGRPTENWQGSATPEGGWGDLWYDPQLRFVVKLRSYPKRANLEGYDLEEIKEGPQADTLFDLPGDYVRMSFADLASFDAANRSKSR